MEYGAYPTRRGIPVSTDEIWLPVSHLDLSKPESYNNHHLAFTARTMGRLLITNTFRNLESMQELLPRDVHNIGRNNLHTLYDPPEPPTLSEAMNKVIEAYDADEVMKVYDLEQKCYVYQHISQIHMKQMVMEYNRESK